MKAVLVIKEPKTCFDCPCLIVSEGACFCQAKNEWAGQERPSWCPLRPLPSFKAVDLNDTRDVVMFCHGWNVCLEEITGETE